MSEELTTVEKILAYVEDQVAHKVPFSAGAYLDLAQKMISLMGNLDDSLIEANMAVNKKKCEFIENGDSAAKAEIKVEATEEYAAFRRLKARRERAQEFIMLAKKRVELQSYDQ